MTPFFSLICGIKNDDELIHQTRHEAEVWITGLNAIITQGKMILEDQAQSRLGKAYADIIQYIAAGNSSTLAETGSFNLSGVSTTQMLGRRYQNAKKGDDVVHPLKVS